jgi:hypothetical protein
MLVFADRLTTLELDAVSTENNVVAGLAFGITVRMGSVLRAGVRRGAAAHDGRVTAAVLVHPQRRGRAHTPRHPTPARLPPGRRDRRTRRPRLALHDPAALRVRLPPTSQPEVPTGAEQGLDHGRRVTRCIEASCVRII